MNKLTEERETMTVDDVKTLSTKGMYLAAGTLVIIFLSMTTCTMHSNTIDPDRLKEEAAIKKVEVEIERAKVDIQRAELAKKEAELKIVERLVTLGVNPIAARCGVYGWAADRNGNQDTACIIAAGKDNTINEKATE